MTLIAHLLEAYAEDIQVRIGPGGELAGARRPIVNVTEITRGHVYSDSLVRISAFNVPHGTWKHAFGYRIQTPDKIIVLSGDTGPSEEVARQCNGCDILLHEGGAMAGTVGAYYQQFHTTAEALARIATAARPRLLVLYHQRPAAPVNHLAYDAFRSLYGGSFMVANDLTVIY